MSSGQLCILAIDPGGKPPNGTTGVALFRIGARVELVDTWAIEGGAYGFSDWLTNMRHFLRHVDVVVCEKYVPYNKAGDPSPMLIEGMVLHEWPTAVFQPASGKNTAIPDYVLKAQGWYDDKSHHHDVREAIRHGLFYLKKLNHHAVLQLFYS